MAAKTFGPGKKDDINGGWYYGAYDSDTKKGSGVATTWADHDTWSGIPADQGGLYCSLPMYKAGFLPTQDSPIPEFPKQTQVEVINPKNGKSVLTELIDRGPEVTTGAPIDLTSDVKQELGSNGEMNFFVEFKILSDDEDDGPISVAGPDA